MIAMEEKNWIRESVLERNLTNLEPSNVKEVDILTDFDGTMIKEESEYLAILAYFFRNSHRVKFLKDVAKEYVDYKKTKNVERYFSLFEGCPIETIDNLVRHLHQNEEWNEAIQKLGIREVGIVSRNNQRIISRYLEGLNLSYVETSLVAANNPESRNGVYTGRAKINVSNENLANIIGKKEYLCREEEKRIIEKSGIDCKRLKGGLYICKKRKLF